MKGLGIGDLMKQAQELQERLSKVQQDAASRTVEGVAGGGMVKATVNGRLGAGSPADRAAACCRAATSRCSRI